MTIRRTVLSPVFNSLLLLCLAILCALIAPIAAAEKPLLNFTDLSNGPAVGVQDGQGSGAIVTLWGQNLGGNQGSSKIYFVDAKGVTRPVAHHYYWQNANGQLPGGPANLYESQMMQEVAVSLPDSSAGKGELYAVVAGLQSNRLPFTVREGAIYHVRPNGNNAAAGSFQQP